MNRIRNSSIASQRAAVNEIRTNGSIFSLVWRPRKARSAHDWLEVSSESTPFLAHNVGPT